VSDPATRDLELVVVDNGSQDLTGPYLEAFARGRGNVQVLTQERNVGYAAAVNLGVDASRSPRLVLLNNDTVLPRGWSARLLAHLGDDVGLVGPLTDGAPGAARVARSWSTLGELRAAAAAVADHGADPVEVERLTYFCAAMWREVWDEVGPLDEGYGIGMFEDDDHLARIRATGRRVLLARDVLVAHLGEATLGTLAPSGTYGRVFAANRRRYERAHAPWSPHSAPEDPEYTAMVGRLQHLVREHVPVGQSLVVVSKGDPALLEIEGRPARHFPADASGEWAGHHPADSDEAIQGLERAVARGDRFVLLPAPQRWWLEQYDGFRDHLGRRYRTVVSEDAGMLFELVGP
jgi:GT2 family glycosyltransferase